MLHDQLEGPSPPNSCVRPVQARAFHAIVTALLLATIACSSSEVSLTGPSGSKCQVTLTNSADTAGAAGGSGTVAVATSRDCTWAASSAAPWVVITSASTGQGDGSVAYRVAANRDPAPRQATIDINASKATISQEAAECRFTVSPRTVAVGAAGGAVTLTIEATGNCGWTAASQAGWIHITSASSGVGSGPITFTVDPNSAGARSGSLTVAGDTITVSQTDAAGTAPPSAPVPAPSCTYAILPTGQTIVAAGGTGSIAVTAGSTCSWTASANVPWITITSGDRGTGPGTVAFTVAVNSGASRSGVISAAGETFIVSQSALACSYSIDRGTDAMGASGGTVTVSVTAGSACGWSAASHASWITVSSGASGTGNGTVRLTAAANSGSARTGTAVIAGQTFTISQSAAPCTYRLSPTSIDVPASGGTGSTQVTAGNGCAWAATSVPSWITITGPTSGTGNGSVSFSAAPNGGVARTGTITISGQALTVNQQSTPCAFDIAPANQGIGAAGGSFPVTVTTTSSCGWTTGTPSADWLTISGSGSGTGGGAVSVVVAANSGPPRTATVTIAGKTLTVNQEAAACAYNVTPPTQPVPPNGGTVSVNVTTTSNCPWAASVGSDWLTIVTAGPGGGSGAASFSATANTTGSPRSGTLTVAGQMVTVTQDPVPCTFSVTLSSQSFPAAGGPGTATITALTGTACSWSTGTSNGDWLTISGSGTGNGTANFNVAPNPGPGRAGTLSIANQPFTITQDGAVTTP